MHGALVVAHFVFVILLVLWATRRAFGPRLASPPVIPPGKAYLVDHVAPAGSPADSGDTLHRIDPALLRKDFEAAGFVFEAQSDMLRNPQDDYAKPMFDPTVRGKTDRFVYRFRRP